MDYFFCVIGMVMFLEGLPYAIFPSKMKKWLRSMLEMPSGALRPLGLLLMSVGVFLVYIGRR
jgi:uncharacterized protein YjeT (DUF2065 family)